MKKITILFFLYFQIGFSQNPVTQYYFIRHSEKVDTSENPNLSQEGKIRAENWAEIFSEITFDAIYATNFLRTIQTATPVSKAKKLEINLYDPEKNDLKTFKEKTKNKTVLVVGHSNSTPEFVNKIIGENKYEKIGETTFGNLYLVTILKKNKITSQLLKLE